MHEFFDVFFPGTESEVKEFMSVCIRTVQKYPLDDYRSPVFIFERLCSIVFQVIAGCVFACQCYVHMVV